jgi:hypothetical protein
MEGGAARAREEAVKVRAALQSSGLLPRINTLLVPHIIHEDGGRPIPLEEKLDPLVFSREVRHELPLSFVLTQVTVFTPQNALDARMNALRRAGIERLVFVGVPRDLGSRKVVGPFPNEALTRYRHMMPSRGGILIPTRPDEEERFHQKVAAGATFALTQMLFTDHIVGFLKKSAARYTERPEVLLSFGFVPQAEQRVGLFKWLIQHEGPEADRELACVARLAETPFRQKKAQMAELVKKIVGGASGLGFPLGLHMECPYGVTEPALDALHAMLEAWERCGGGMLRN